METFNKKILTQISKILVREEETIAVAESVTTGILQMAIGTTENASAFFQGGITTYNLGQKYRHIKVDPIHAEKTNSVSQRVANEMAANVCELFLSDWGIGITGYATAVTESDFKTFAYFSIVHKGKIRSYGRLIPDSKDTMEIQVYYVNKILQKLNSLLK